MLKTKEDGKIKFVINITVTQSKLKMFSNDRSEVIFLFNTITTKIRNPVRNKSTLQRKMNEILIIIDYIFGKILDCNL